MKNKTLISELRTQRGWTQEYLANESGLSVRTIQRLESGEDSSLETLRLVADALKVPITELFQDFKDSEKEKEVLNFSVEQTMQMRKRISDENLFKLVKLLYFLVMIALAACVATISKESLQEVFGIIWLSTFLIGFGVIRYIRSSWWETKLDEKYPLTTSLPHPKTNNGEKALWWNDKTARPIMLVFWGAIIPLLFILKYALNIF